MAAAAAAVGAAVEEAADDSVDDGSKNEDLHKKRERRVAVMGGSTGEEVEEGVEDGVEEGVEVVEEEEELVLCSSFSRLFPFSSFLAILTRQASSLAAELAAGRFLLIPIFVLLKLDATVVASTSMVRR